MLQAPGILAISSAARNRRGCKGRCACIHNNLPRCDRSHAPAWECSSRRSCASFRRGARGDASRNHRKAALFVISTRGRDLQYPEISPRDARRKNRRGRRLLQNPQQAPATWPFRAQREIAGAAKEGALAFTTTYPGVIVPTLQRGNAAPGAPAPRSDEGRVGTRLETIEKLPCLSSRPEGEISNIPRFLLAMLVEKTDAGGVCSNILSKRPRPRR